MSNELTPNEYLSLIRQKTAKIKTRLINPKTNPPDEIGADQYRAEHVDQVEHGLQARCVKWFRLQYPNLLLFAVPNAAKRSYVLAEMLLAEGMVSGVPDLVLAYPVHGKPGLYIEMKTVKGDPSDNQIKIQAYLRAVGYEVAQPRTFEAFQQVIINYLESDHANGHP